MAEQKNCVAGRAGIRCVDVSRRHARIHQLAAIGLHQIKEQVDGKLAVARRTCGQKEQRILFAHRIRFLYLAEKFGSVGELAFELLTNFFSYLIAAGLHTRSNGSDHIAWVASKVSLHLADGFLDDALHRAAPSRVKYTDSVIFLVGQDDGDAVGGLDAKQQAGRVSDESIAGQRIRRHAVDPVNEVGVNLAECDEHCVFVRHCQLFKEQGAIAFYGGA